MTNYIRKATKAALPVLALCTALNSAGHGHNHHDHGLDQHHGHGHHHAHVHGLASVTLAQDDKQIWVSMRVPGYDMLGFERQPRNDDEVALIKTTMEKLRQPQSLLALEAEANCEFKSADVDVPLLNKDHQGHADFEVNQQFECKNPEALSKITITLFERYSSIQQVNMQWTLEGKQGSAKVKAADATVKLK